jgi:hypothetical protein
LVCRWLLESIDQQREVFQVVEREAERFPKLREKWRVELLESAHRAAVAFTQRWAEKTGHPSRDPEASAVIMVGASHLDLFEQPAGAASCARKGRRFAPPFNSDSSESALNR